MAELGLAIAPIAYKALVRAWKTLDDALSFSEDSEDLLIRLETVRAHLSIWATLSELDSGRLHPSLRPFDELIEKALKRICTLISDVGELEKEYGVASSRTEESQARKPTNAIVQMRRSLHAAISTSKAKTSKLEVLLEQEASALEISGQDGPNAMKRLQWAIRDKKRFEVFIDKLEKHVDGLHKLLPNTQLRQVQQEQTRLGLEVIRGLSDPGPLSQLQNASLWYQGSSEIDIISLAQWKSITLKRTTTEGLGLIQNDGLTVTSLNPSDRVKSRFLQRGRVDFDSIYLFERKEYDANITDTDKDLLKERIRKLVSLLGGQRAQSHLHTLQAVDYMDDPEFHCWWIVFRFPSFTSSLSQSAENEPLSLRKLYASPSKPALEQRYALAKRLAGTFAKLYGSDWMHKSISSNNIIFPQLASEECIKTYRAITSALVQGFGYSRQHTEAQTIDRGRVLGDLESAIYRHPNYQGEAASGYKIHYDIYSLGLILFEIAIWDPLLTLLAAKSKVKPPVDLSPNMVRFHQVEAMELKRRAMIRVEYDLPYRMGSKYAEVVKWCLNLKGPVTATEFYNTVVIPIDELCN